jgi:hypothetical protein
MSGVKLGAKSRVRASVVGVNAAVPLPKDVHHLLRRGTVTRLFVRLVEAQETG